MMRNHSTTAPACARSSTEAATAETKDVTDAIDLLARAISLNTLAIMATEDLPHWPQRGAFAVGLSCIDVMLEEVKTILDATVEREGGAA